MNTYFTRVISLFLLWNAKLHKKLGLSFPLKELHFESKNKVDVSARIRRQRREPRSLFTQPPAMSHKKKSSLLESSSSEDEQEDSKNKPALKVNPRFAQEYEAKKKAEELSRRECHLLTLSHFIWVGRKIGINFSFRSSERIVW